MIPTIKFCSRLKLTENILFCKVLNATKKDTPSNLYYQEYHNTKTKLDLTKLF